MPKDKTETHERIIPAAMKIFLEKGFEKATMREIAEEAGITAAGLYRHFVDKEAMFAALVEPVLSELQKWCERTRQVDYDFLEQGDLDAMWDSGNDLGLVVEQIYSHFNEFKLLLCCSAGTKYAWFLHDIVVMEQQETLAYMEEAKKHGVPVKEVDPKELHLLMTAYTNALFEVVVHDFTKEEALQAQEGSPRPLSERPGLGYRYS